MDELAQLKQQVAELTKQISGLAAERNTYRQELDATRQELQALTTTNAGGHSSVPMYGHPFAGLVENPQQIDAWVAQQIQAKLQEALGQSKYVTSDYLMKDFLGSEPLMKLLTQIAMQSYQAARGDAMLWRNFDRMTGREVPGPDGKPSKPYADLNNYGSDYAKKVATILQERKLGEPMHDKAQDFATDWRYQSPEALQFAADLARMEMTTAATAAATATTTGQQAQGAAGLSATPPGGQGAAAPNKVQELMDANADPSEVLAAMESATGGP